MANLISMVGCNAIGKTTAARRYVERCPGLVAVLMDVQTILGPGSATRREPRTKGTVAEKQALVDELRAVGRVVLLESARTTHLEATTPDEPIILVTCTPQLYERHMRVRCAAKEKTFREDYWDGNKLAYESGRRYVNWAGKYLTPDRYQHFEITDQAADWPAVDSYFFQVYARLYNQLLKREFYGTR